MTRVTASLPSELGAALERSARENERSLAAEARLALCEHLKAFPSVVVEREEGPTFRNSVSRRRDATRPHAASS